MARVTIADVCPKCNSVGELQKGICQACGTNTLWYSNLYFKSYKNATIQHSNIIVSQVFKESEHKQKEKHLKDVERAASDFYQNAHQTLRVASLHEARSFLQHAMHATTDGESMKALGCVAQILYSRRKAWSALDRRAGNYPGGRTEI
jgi:hypothetical protein